MNIARLNKRQGADVTINRHPALFLSLPRCLLESIDTKKPYISDDLKRIRKKMENLGYASKSKLDADFRKIVCAANNEGWTDESGKKFYPLKREDVLKGIEEMKMLNDDIGPV